MPAALVLALLVMCPALDGLANGASATETFESVSTSNVQVHFEAALLAPDADRTGAGVRPETVCGLVFVSLPGGVLDRLAPRDDEAFRRSVAETRTDAAELSRISRLQQQYLAFAGAIVPSERDFFSSHVQTLPPPIRRLTS